MTKQEFLAMSLPYELKAQFKIDEKKGCRQKVIGTIGVVYDNGSVVFYDTVSAYTEKFKMILHPLSDLTKEIEHNGEKFVPMEKLREVIGSGWCDNYEEAMYFVQDCSLSTLKEKILYLPFEFIRLFISWHFDIADLISKGEAIDVNTLEVNPYK